MYPQVFVRVNEMLERIGLSTFNILVGVGILVMLLSFVNSLEKHNGYSREATNKLLILFAIALGVTYVFAAFFDALFHFLADGEFDGGITFIAGFMGGVFTFIILIYFFMKEERKNILKILNIIIPSVIIAHAIGRIGCFSVGCCYGKETTTIFGVYFPAGTNPYIDGIREHIHPTQLYESFFLFALYFTLKYIPRIKEHNFSIYLISYGIFRFIIEKYLRGDNRGVLFNIPPSELLSLVMLLIGIGILVYKIYQMKKLHLKYNNEV